RLRQEGDRPAGNGAMARVGIGVFVESIEFPSSTRARSVESRQQCSIRTGRRWTRKCIRTSSVVRRFVRPGLNGRTIRERGARRVIETQSDIRYIRAAAAI